MTTSRGGWRRARGLGATLVLVALLAGCSASGDGDAEPPATVDEPAIRDVPVVLGGADSLALSPTQRAHDVGVSFQSGPFLVTLGTVVHDRADDTLYLGMRFQNLGPSWAVPQPEAKLIVDGTEHHVFPSGVPRVPPLHSTVLTGTVSVGDVDPLAVGSVRFGRPDETQTTVELASGRAEGFGPPVPVPIDEWGQIGKHTVHLTGGELMADAVRAPRAPTGQRVLRLNLDEYSSTGSPVNGFHPADHFLLRWPDGTEVEPLGGSTGRGTLSWTAATGGWVDFPVPAEPAGRYEALLASVGVHSFSNLHPHLVERVAIPVMIPEDVIQGPTTLDPTVVGLPVPVLPDTGASPEAVDADLDLSEVNLPGFAYTATHVSWDPDSRVVRVDGRARLVPPIVAASTGGLFDTPSSFAPSVALDLDGTVHNGLISSGVVRVEGDQPVDVAFEFSLIDRFDPASATLLLGQDHMAASMLPLGPESRLLLWPAVPELGPVEAPVVNVGNYRVQVVGWRFGLPRELDRPPPGRLALELVVEITAAMVEEPGPFGLGFSTRTQLFVTGPDGYLQQSDNHDQAFLEDGESVRLGASFYVSDRWRPGPLTLTVRSRDEITAITSLEWVETTFVAELLAPEEGS